MSDIYIHPTALVETTQIGEGTRIWAMVHVMKQVSLGKNCNIGDHCFLEAGAVVGDNVTIKNGNMLWEGVTLEDGVFVGPHVFFTNDRYPRSPRHPAASQRYATREWLVPTLVQEGASLGAAAVIVPGVTIGSFAMVGAGAVVTADVPPYALVLGNPARLHGWVCRCGLPLQFGTGNEATCACGQRFRKEAAGVVPLSPAA